MLKAYKTEINPTGEQRIKMNKTFGVCRFVYNLFLQENKKLYKESGKYMSGYDFSRWLNNEFIPNNPSFSWIKEVGSKAVKKSIMNADTAFKKFFKKESGFPKFKKRNSRKTCYFPKNNKYDLTAERHRIKIPTFGFVRLKEYGYIPIEASVKSCVISMDVDRYFVSALCEVSECESQKKGILLGIGIDLGIKQLAVCSNGKMFENINKTQKVKKLEKKLRREQRALSRKMLKRKKIKKEESIKSRPANIIKNILRVQRLHRRLRLIRVEYIRTVVNSLVLANNLPSYVAIEDLNVRGMMKNKHLSKAIQQQLFGYFRRYLIQRTNKYGVEVRIINRFYASSKICNACGSINDKLKLSDRIYRCVHCGNVIDRDVNASFNIRDCNDYKIAA